MHACVDFVSYRLRMVRQTWSRTWSREIRRREPKKETNSMHVCMEGRKGVEELYMAYGMNAIGGNEVARSFTHSLVGKSERTMVRSLAHTAR